MNNIKQIQLWLNQNYDKISTVLLGVFGFAILFLLLVLVGKQNIGLCIFSVSPTRRTPAYVKSCYDSVEKQSGIKVDRFGDGVEKGE